jgi:hypothetical protein
MRVFHSYFKGLNIILGFQAAAKTSRPTLGEEVEEGFQLRQMKAAAQLLKLLMVMLVEGAGSPHQPQLCYLE